MEEYEVVNDDGEPVQDGIYESKTKANARARRMEKSLRGSTFHVEVIGQSDETNDGDSDNTMTYDFVDTNDDESENNFGNQRWGLGDHNGLSAKNKKGLLDSIEATMEEADESMDEELRSVLEDASGLVSQTTVTQFECPVEACGLGHSHPDTKHDIRSTSTGYNVTREFADRMQFCPYCHCGVNELSMLMEFFHYIDTEVFNERDFSGVRDLDPDVVNMVYNQMQTEGKRFQPAIKYAAAEYGQPTHVLIPSEVRDELRDFINLRQSIDTDAGRAPIHSEARNQISELRDGLLDVTDSHPEEAI